MVRGDQRLSLNDLVHVRRDVPRGQLTLRCFGDSNGLVSGGNVMKKVGGHTNYAKYQIMTLSTVLRHVAWNLLAAISSRSRASSPYTAALLNVSNAFSYTAMSLGALC